METVSNIQEFEMILAENDAVLAYFSTEVCSVCKVLKPKVSEMVAKSFPKLKMVFVESDKLPELAAQNRIFTAPTVVVFFDGRETIRKSRAFGVDELRSEIQRPYSLIFDLMNFRFFRNLWFVGQFRNYIVCLFCYSGSLLGCR